MAIVSDRNTHRASMRVTAAYLEQSEGAERDPIDFVPEFSRRGRAIPLYAALRQLGRRGVSDLVERCCRHAARFAELLGAESGVQILNDVVLNQTLVRFEGADGETDEMTRAVVRGVQDAGVCWLSGTTWHGMAAMRISVSNWWTSDEDVAMSAKSILDVFRALR
jgi:glutamate/tyrosine decarboxylase-like PLP-dependent enzyme